MSFRSKVSYKIRELKYGILLGNWAMRLLNFDVVDFPEHDDEQANLANLTVVSHLADTHGLAVRTFGDGRGRAYGNAQAVMAFVADLEELRESRSYFDTTTLLVEMPDLSERARLNALLRSDPRVSVTWEGEGEVLLRGRKRELDNLVEAVELMFGQDSHFLEMDV